MVRQPYRPYVPAYDVPQPKAKINPLILAGFITACVSLLINLWGLVGIAGLVLSIMGYHQTAGTTENGRGFAIAGIVIGAFSVLCGFATLIFMDTFLSLLF